MTLDEHVAGLRSTTSNVRLHAARELGRLGDPTAMDALGVARATELNSWVLRAIDGSLEKLRRSAIPTATGALWIAQSSEEDVEDLLAGSTQRATGTLIHEARPLLTDIASAGEDLLGEGYPGSELGVAVSRMQAFLDTMAQLHNASHPATFIEFDLSALVADLVSQKSYEGCNVVATRSDPTIVRGDPNLLRVAVDNVIRNAVEASAKDRSRVVVHCAATDKDAWISVLDWGEGLPGDVANAFSVGTTSKSKDEHFGIGLAIVGQAVRSMRGSVILAPRDPQGTSCEIRWNQGLQEAPS